MSVGRYAKTLVAAVIAGLSALHLGLDGDALSPADWKTVGAEIITMIAVYAFPNAGKPSGKQAEIVPQSEVSIREGWPRA